MTGASIETTLELWASSLREVKGRMRGLFTQERVAASAGLFLDGLLGDERRKTGWMEQFIGLNVSSKDTFISVRDGGARIWRGKCPSDPKLIAEVIRKRAPSVKRVVLETGSLSVWFYRALKQEDLPTICIDARHAKAALNMAPNKTDANDADGLAHLAEVGFCRRDQSEGVNKLAP
jgi:hypothetical protein